MRIRNFKHALKIIDAARESGLISRDRYLRHVCRICLKTTSYIHLQKYLNQNPHVAAQLDNLVYQRSEAYKKDPFMPYPNLKEMHLIEGCIQIGTVNYHHDLMGLNPIDFTRIVFGCGMPGCGKTTLNRAIVNDFLEWQHELDTNVIIIQDSKRDLDSFIIKFPKLRVLEWKDLRFNMWEVEPWDDFDAKLNCVFDVFSAANWLLQHTHPVGKRAVKRCYDNYEKTGIPFNFEDIKRYVKPAAKSIGLEGFRQKDAIDHINFTLESFIQTKDTLNCRCGLSIEEFWSKENVVVNLMGESNPYVKATFVMTLFKELQRYYERYPTPHKLHTLIDIDECRYVLLSKTGNREVDHDPDRPLIQWAATRRSSGIGLIAFTQEIMSAPNWLVDNASFIIGFPVMGESREKLARVLNLTPEQYDHIDHMTQTGMAIVNDIRFPRRIKVITEHLETEEVTQKEVQDLMQPWISDMHGDLKYKGQSLIRKATLPSSDTNPAAADPEIKELRDKMYRHTKEFFQWLRANQFKSKSQLFEPARKANIRINRPKFLKSLDWLVKEELVVDKKIAISTTPSTFYVITKKGHDVLGTPKTSKHRYELRHFEHTLSCHIVKTYLESCGYDPKREKDNIDVFCEIKGKKVAFEYINTGMRNLVMTAYKTLISLGMDEIVFVLNSNPDKETAQEIINNSALIKSHSDKFKSLIKYKLRSDFIKKEGYEQ